MLRIDLRAPRANDRGAIDSWIAEAVTAVSGGSSPAAAPVTWQEFRQRLTPSQAVLVVTRDLRPVGFAVFRGGKAAVRLDAIAIAADKRNLGLGTDAVLALEQRFTGRPLLAGVPPANGLAIYFWLRAGYRPIYPRPTTAALASDRLWMRRPRDLTAN